ncbi:hypothetical protein QN277_001251 [Acacia crassicarpa]|nr:hypothetical protein QN277_001251 [Acacia crassicarpa]
MYLVSSIRNSDEWATRGGLEKTYWRLAPFVSSYKDFTVEACQWEEPYPPCVSTTTQNWRDQYDAWHLSNDQKIDHVGFSETSSFMMQRFSTLHNSSLSPWD